MLFADSSLARRLEQAERGLTTDVATKLQKHDPGRSVFIRELGGGVVVHVGSESPFNKMIGIGLGGPLTTVDEQMLEAVECEFAARATPLQAEVCILADSSVPRLFTERGYRLLGFENVLGLRLDSDLAARLSALPFPAELQVSPTTESEGAAWMDAVATAFEHSDAVPGGESHESFSRAAIEQAMTDMLRADGFSRHLARMGGDIAGGASLRLGDGVAQLCGAATLPQHRRRGVQTALLARRLLTAWHSGCDVATITTQPGSKSQENAHRRGFTLLYSRAILVRAPA